MFRREFPKFTYPEQVRKLLEYMLENPHFTVKPVFSEKEIISYPDIMKITELSFKEVILLLKELLDAKWIQSRVSSNLPSCPKCDSINVVSHFSCPHCGSTNLISGPVIKHLTCNFIGFISDFKEMNEFICPNCEEKLDIKDLGKTWVAPGIWYQCSKCRRFFETPDIIFECLSCNHTFRLDEVKLFNVYEYYLNPFNFNIVTEYTGSFADLISELAIKGWNVAYPASIHGKSPTPHTFTFNFIYKSVINCVADVIYSPLGVVDKTHVLTFVSKIVDIEATHKLIIAVPQANDEAKETAEISGVDLIEAKSISDVKQKIKEYLENLKESLSKEKVAEDIDRISKLLENL